MPVGFLVCPLQHSIKNTGTFRERKRLEVKESPLSAPIERKPNRRVHWARPDLIAGIEFTSWTQDGVLRQAALKEVRERSDKTLRPDWVNLPRT